MSDTLPAVGNDVDAIVRHFLTRAQRSWEAHLRDLQDAEESHVVIVHSAKGGFPIRPTADKRTLSAYYKSPIMEKPEA